MNPLILLRQFKGRPIGSLACVLAVGFVLSASTLQAQQTKPPQAKRYREVYVPIEQIHVVDENRPHILLERAKFQELWKAAQANRARQTDKPKGFWISSVDYAGRLAGNQLLVTAKCRIEKSTQGWDTLALDLHHWTVEKATLEDQPALVHTHPNQPKQLVLFSNQSGTMELELTLSTPTALNNSNIVAAINLLTAPAGEFRMTLPEGKVLLVNSREIAADDEGDTATFATGAVDALQLVIRDPERKSTVDSFYMVQSVIATQVAPSEIGWQASSNLQVFGSNRDQFSVVLPAGLEITAVESKELDRWEMIDDPASDGTLLTIDFRRPFQGSRPVILRGIITVPLGEAWSVAGLNWKDALSHVGRVAVLFPSRLRLETIEQESVRPIESNRVQDVPNTNIQTLQRNAFEFTQEDFTLRFVAQLKDRQLQAAITSVVELAESEPQLQVVVNTKTMFAALDEFLIELPAEWEVRGTTVAGQAVTWTTDSEEPGLNLIRIPFPNQLAPGEKTTIVLTAGLLLENWPPGADSVSLQIPNLRLPQVSTLEGAFGVTGGFDFEVFPEELSGLDPDKLELDGERLGYRFQNGEIDGTLVVRRKPSRFSTLTTLVTRVAPDAWTTHIESKFQSEGGGLRELTILLSEAAGTNIRFSLLNRDERIAEQSAGAVQDGMRPWTLKFDRYLKGEVILVGTAVQQPPAEGQSAELIRVDFPNADTQQGYVAIEAGGDHQIQIQAQSTSGRQLKLVDPIDFPAVSYRFQDRIVGAYQFTDPRYRIGVTAIDLERLAVPSTIGVRNELRSVIHEESIHHEMRLQFYSPGTNNIELAFAGEVDLWGVLLDGEPLEIRRGAAGYTIPIPASENPNTERMLELYYSSRITSRGRLQQDLPRVTVVDSLGNRQPFEMIAHSWRLHYPADLLLTSSQGEFVLDGPLEEASLFQRLRRNMGDWNSRHFGQRVVVIVVVGAVLALVVYIFARTRPGERFKGITTRIVELTVVCAIIGVLIAVLMPAVQQSREAARRSEARNKARLHGLDAEMAGESESFEYDEYYDDSVVSKGQFESGPAGSESPPMEGEAGEALGLERRAIQEKEVAQKELAKAIEQERKQLEDLRQIESKARFESQNRADMAKDAPELTERFSRQPTAEPASPPTLNRVPGDPFGVDKVEVGGVIVQSPQPQSGELFMDDFGRGSMAGNAAGGGFGGGGVPANAPVRGRLSGIDNDGDGLADADNLFAFAGVGDAAGLMSLQFDLEIPEGTKSRTFEYLGLEQEQIPALDLGFLSRQSLSQKMMLTIGVTGLVLLLLCRLSRRLFWSLSLLGLAATLGSLPFIPAEHLPFADGFVVATGIALVLASAAWLITSIPKWCNTCWSKLSSWADTSLPKRNKKSKATETAGAIALLISGAWNVHAEDIAPPQVPPVADTSIMNVVVPYDVKQGVQGANRVMLPLETYRQLLQASEPPAAAPGQASLIHEANYRGKVIPVGDDHRVEFTARIAVTTFKNEPVNVHLPFRKVLLSEVKLDGEDASVLLSDPQQPASLIIDQPGLHVIDATFSVNASDNLPASGKLLLELSPVASGVLRFELPAENTAAKVNSSDRVYRYGTTDDGTKFIEFGISHGGENRIAWQPETKQRDASVFALADAVQSVQFQDAGITWTSHYDLTVRQGAMNEITFKFPEQYNLLKVGGPAVAGWKIDAVKQELQLVFREPIRDATTIDFELFTPWTDDADEKSFDLPIVRATSVTRETGLIGLHIENDFDLRVTDRENLTQINPQQYLNKSKLKSNLNQAFRFGAQDYSLSLKLSPKVEKRTVTAYHGVSINQHKLQLATQLHYRIQGPPASRLQVYYPFDFVPLRVDGPGLSDWYLSEDEETLIFEFAEPVRGNVVVTMEGFFRREEGDDFAAIDVPYPLEVDELTAFTGVWLKEPLDGTLDVFTGWETIAQADLPSIVRNLKRTAARFAFRSESMEPDLISMTLKKIPPIISLTTVSLIAVDEGTTDYGFTMKWNIDRSVTNQLQFDTPSWLDQRIEFSGQGIRRTGSENLGNGWARWTITLEQPISGEYALTAAATVRAQENRQIRVPRLKLITPDDEQANGISQSRQQHFAVLVNLSDGQIEPNAALDPLIVTKERLPLTIRDELLAQAMLLLRIDPNQPELSLVHRPSPVRNATAAVIKLAKITSVLTADGSYRTQCVYTIKNRSRQFFAVRLPESSRLLSVIVDGRPSRALKGMVGQETVSLIALPILSEADLAFDVKLILAGRIPRAFPRSVWGGRARVDLPAPSVVSRNDSDRYGISVQHTQWSIYIPKDVVASVDSGSPNNNVQPAERRQALEVTSNIYREEVSGLNRILLGKSYSKEQRAMAKSNLKELKLRYEEEARENDFDDEETEQLLEEAEQQAEQITLGEDVDANANGIVIQNGRDFILSNNGTILSDNYDLGPQIQQPVEEALSYGVPVQSKPQQQSAGKGVDRGELREELQMQNTFINDQLKIQRGVNKNLNGDGAATFNDYNNGPQVQYWGQFGPVQDRTMGQPTNPSLKSRTIINNTPMEIPDSAAERFSVPVTTNEGYQPAYEYTAPRQAGRAEGRQVGGEDETLTTSPGWTSTTGVSIDFELPTDGRELVLMKVGGEPKLTLLVYPESAFRDGKSVVWAVVWGLGLLFLLVALFKGFWRSKAFYWALFIWGCGAFLLVDGPTAGIGFLSVCVGVIGLTVHCCGGKSAEEPKKAVA